MAGTTFRDKLKEGSDGPQMVSIPAGKFMMGGDKYDDEKPIHEVTIAHPLAIGQYPVTVGQFKKFVQATNYLTEAEEGDGAYVWIDSWLNPGWKKKADANWKNPHFSQTDNHPVVCVSWHDAQAYCRWLSEQTGHKYRLPSEAEWEYACRAGTTTQYSFGDDEAQLGEYAWFSDNSGNKTHPVGEKKPNPWGLYDMHGNVWEWCEDVWHGNYNGAPIDGSAWITGGEQQYRLLRGGSWRYVTPNCRSANRYRYDDRYYNSGFRLSSFSLGFL